MCPASYRMPLYLIMGRDKHSDGTARGRDKASKNCFFKCTCTDFIKDAATEVVGDDWEAVLGSLQLVVELLVQVPALLLRADDVQHFPAGSK